MLGGLGSTPLPASQDPDELVVVAAPAGGTPPDPPSGTTIATDPDSPDRRPRYRLYSWVWNHGDLSFSNRGQRLWKCKHCPSYRPGIYHCSSTTHIAEHLRSRHNIRRDLVSPPTAAAANQATLATLRPNPNVLRKALVSWVLSDHQAFRQVESATFRQFLAAIMPLQPNSLLPTRLTLRRWVLSTFDENKVTIAMHLAAAKSHISISFDGWTSPNNISFLGIVAHWSDEEYNLRSALISLKEVQFSHAGTDLATIVMTVLEGYGILDKISYFMSDNAPNMTRAIEEISRQLFVLGNTILTPEERRLRCYEHIVNLVANAILGKTARFDESIHLETSDTENFQAELDSFLQWRRHGPLEKLQGFTVFLRASVARRNLFISIQSDHLHQPTAFMIRLANATRWNSSYDMIQDALKLRDAIDIFLGVLAAQARDPREREKILRHQLTAAEWDELSTIGNLLAPLKEVSSMMEGNITGSAGYHGNGALSDVLPGFDLLLDHLERSKEMLMGVGDTHLATCVNLAWEKLDAYYKLTDSSTVYLVAAVLDPRLKMAYFEHVWGDRPEWLRMAYQHLERSTL